MNELQAAAHDPIRIAVFASGRGSTFQAIERTLAAMPDAPATIALCVSNNPHPGVFEHARSAGVPSIRMSPKMFASEAEYAGELATLLASHRIEMIVLAGYMRQLPVSIVRAYRGHILNIHPALLPRFGGRGMYGIHVHEAVIAAGEVETGATVHLVDEEYDTGPIIAQEHVPVHAGDTPETLAARVLAAEHELYPRIIIECARAISNDRQGIPSKHGPARDVSQPEA